MGNDRRIIIDTRHRVVRITAVLRLNTRNKNSIKPTANPNHEALALVTIRPAKTINGRTDSHHLYCRANKYKAANSGNSR